MENQEQDLSYYVMGLIAFNAMIFATLYFRKSRPELVERYLAWVRRAHLTLADKRSLPGAR